MPMNTPESIANAPRTEGGAWDAPPPVDTPVDTPAVAPHVPAPLTPERPDDGADDRTTAALGDLMPTPGD
jgi:hypothetical protein